MEEKLSDGEHARASKLGPSYRHAWGRRRDGARPSRLKAALQSAWKAGMHSGWKMPHSCSLSGRPCAARPIPYSRTIPYSSYPLLANPGSGSARPYTGPAVRCASLRVSGVAGPDLGPGLAPGSAPVDPGPCLAPGLRPCQARHRPPTQGTGFQPSLGTLCVPEACSILDPTSSRTCVHW